LGYRFEIHDGDADALCVAAGSAVRSPIFRTTVDVTLAVRKALRRYLGVEYSRNPRSKNHDEDGLITGLAVLLISLS